jgi:hypothetical protein
VASAWRPRTRLMDGRDWALARDTWRQCDGPKR